MSTGKTPVPERVRMLLRIGVVGVGYLLYLAVRSGGLPGAVMVWAGTIILGWALIDRYTKFRRERSALLETGSLLLGTGLLLLGAALALS